MPLRRFRILAALIALAPALLGAQEPRSAAVAGRVLVRADTGAPAPARRAAVAIVGTSAATTTGPDGRFLLVTERAANRIDVFRVLANGELSQVSGSPSAAPGAFAAAGAAAGAAPCVTCGAVDCAKAAMAMQNQPVAIMTLRTYFIQSLHTARRDFWSAA